MVDKIKNTRLELLAPFASMNWGRVLEILQSRGGLTQTEAEHLLSTFVKKLLSPFEVSWFKASASAADIEIIAAICEANSSDTVSISYERAIQVLPMLSIGYAQRIKFIPQTQNEERAYQPLISITALGWKVDLDSYYKIVIARLLLILLAIACYVILVGLAIYSISVFALFQELPREVLLAIFERPFIGVGLLCFIIGASGLIGRGILVVARGCKRLLAEL